MTSPPRRPHGLMTTSSPTKPLAGRIALVTGATRGIGAAIALGYAEAGAHVIAVGRTQGGLEALDDKIFAATAAHASLVPLDLMDGDAIDRLDAALSSGGLIDDIDAAVRADCEHWHSAVVVPAWATQADDWGQGTFERADIRIDIY